MLTELILENTFANYEPEEVVALLSCFVFQEKTDVEPAIPPKLEQGRDAIMAISDRVGGIQDSHKVAAEEFRSNLKFGLVEVVYEWAKGVVSRFPLNDAKTLDPNPRLGRLAIRTNHFSDGCGRGKYRSCDNTTR